MQNKSGKAIHDHLHDAQALPGVKHSLQVQTAEDIETVGLWV